MANCQNCGHEVNYRAKFCEACGSALLASEQNMAVNAPPSVSVAIGNSGMSVMLISPGDCTPQAAADAMTALCGYPDEDAPVIASSMPITIAQRLTMRQAAHLAQELNSYGLEVAVYGSNGYIESAPHESDAPIEPMSLRNRIERHLMRPWNYPYCFAGEKPPAFR